MFHKTRQVLHEFVIFLKCESIFSCNTVLYRVIKISSETYKAFSRPLGKSTQIFHGNKVTYKYVVIEKKETQRFALYQESPKGKM